MAEEDNYLSEKIAINIIRAVAGKNNHLNNYSLTEQVKVIDNLKRDYYIVGSADNGLVLTEQGKVALKRGWVYSKAYRNSMLKQLGFALSLIIATISLIISVCSCQEEPLLSVNASSGMYFPVGGGKDEISFIANKEWKVVSSEPAWCVVTPTSGVGSEEKQTVKIVCAKNQDYDSRSCTITFLMDGLSQSIDVFQEMVKGIFPSTHEYQLSNEEQIITLEVLANVAYEIVPQYGWITLLSGTKGLNSSKISFRVSGNDGYDERTGHIYFLSKTGDVDGTITIHQDKTYGIIVEPSSLNLSFKSQDVDIEVLNNCDFDVVIPSAASGNMIKSVTRVNTKALSTSKYRINIAENNQDDARETEITFKQKNGPACGSLKIKQAAKEILEVSHDSVAFPYSGGRTQVSLSSNVEYSIQTSGANWISIEESPETRSLDHHIYIISANENTSTSRSSDIVFKGANVNALIRVFQDSAPLVSLDSVVTMDCLAGASAEIHFNYLNHWSVREVGDQTLLLDHYCGDNDEIVCRITTKEANCTNSDKVAELEVSCDGYSRIIKVKQMPAFRFDSLNQMIPASGGSIKLYFTFPRSDYSGVRTYDYDNGFIGLLNSTAIPNYAYNAVSVNYAPLNPIRMYMMYTFQPNLGPTERNGKFRLCFEENGQLLTSEWVTVTQGTGNYSTDYSSDGKITALQKHSLGEGVPIVFVGDGFKDTDITNGKYDTAMREAYGYFFSVEPLSSLKEYYDVWSITAVSASSSFDGISTRFKTLFGLSTHIEGDDQIAYDYASKVVPANKRNDMLVVVVINSRKYAGTCYLHYTDYNYSSGCRRVITYSVAYVPMAQENGMTFENVIHHEACGHGMGKLADEYSGSGTIPSSEKNTLQLYQNGGAYTNVDLHTNVNETSWSRFAADSRFATEQIGAYEGAYTYSYGVYRPSQTSIMVSNKGIFNAPSRAQIYKRTMSIAFNGTWEFDYEAFVSFDEPIRERIYTKTSLIQREPFNYSFVPLAPPVFVKD